MKILALEFSSSQRSVAVVQSGTIHEAIETGRRAGNLLGMIEEVLRASSIEREQIDSLAVGLGPGSYAGIRSAIALAQGWQLALGTKILGVSTVEYLARQAREEGCSGKIAIVIDAQRGDFYFAGYEMSDKDERQIEPLRLAKLAEVSGLERAGYLLVGPDISGPLPTSRAMHPRASVLGRLAQGRLDFVPGEKLEPVYLREVSFVKATPPRIIPQV